MQRKTIRRRRARGFTLMEVLLVVAILIILAGLATVAISRTYVGARKNAAKLDINTLTQTMDAYYLDIGSYPPSLDALVTQPDSLANPMKWNGPYLQKGLPADPWGNQYQYSNDGDQFKIWSMGPNGTNGDEDDISAI
jgi:general secretion pathway protein G